MILVCSGALSCHKHSKIQKMTKTLDGLPGWSVEWGDSSITVINDERRVAVIEMVRSIGDHNIPGRLVHVYDDYNDIGDSLYYLMNTNGAIAAYRNIQVDGNQARVEYDHQGRIVKIVNMKDNTPISMDAFMREYSSNQPQ